MKNDISLWQIFLVFSKIGAFTIGGGYAMIPVIEDEMRRRDWIDREEIPDIVVLAQSAPGLLAVNMAIFAGYRIRGIKGSIAATVGAVLPSFIAILVIAMTYNAFKENAIVTRFFAGLRPVAIALILVPMVRMARKGCRVWWHWVLMLATIVGICFFGISPIFILLAIIITAVLVLTSAEGRGK